LVALARALGERVEDQGLERRVEAALDQERRRPRLLLEVTGEDLLDRAVPRNLAGDELVEQDADAVDVARGRRRLAADPLGRDVVRRPRQRGRGARRGQGPREPEVEQLDDRLAALALVLL